MPVLSEERLRELKAKVRDDFYDSPDVVRALAGRLIRSGDLGTSIA